MQSLRKISHSDIYFFGLVFLVASLPLSVFTMSVSQFILAINWIWEGDFKRKFQLLVKRKSIWVFILIYLVHVFGLIHTSWPEGFLGDSYNAIKDLRLKLPLLLLPIIIGTSKALTAKQLKYIILFLCAAVTANSFISTGVLLGITNIEINDIRDISLFISHIRFALLINTAIFALIWLIYSNKYSLSKQEKVFYHIVMIWLIVFLFILQSLTGIVILILCSFFLSFILIGRIKKMAFKIAIGFFSFLIPVASVFYIADFITEFRKFDIVIPDTLEKNSPYGNEYSHDIDDLQIENGHWVGLYNCDKEMQIEWDKISDYKFEGLDKKGQRVKYTLIRYLTSKGVRKDADGVKSLTVDDVRLIEDGHANYIFGSKNRLYTRFYQVVWEVDLYLRGGNPGGHSVSQRIEFLRVGSSIIKAHPFFGVGTGDVQPEYTATYEKLNTKLKKKYRHRAHNQYFTFVIALGFVGLAIILFGMFYPPYYEKRYKDFLFVSFMIIAIISMLNEDTLETQPGVTFFTFFYCLFVFGREKNIEK